MTLYLQICPLHIYTPVIFFPAVLSESTESITPIGQALL